MILIEQDACENVVCEIAAIFSRPERVKEIYSEYQSVVTVVPLTASDDSGDSLVPRRYVWSTVDIPN